MRLDIRRDALLIIPENDLDCAFLEDTLGARREGDTLTLERVGEVSLGYKQSDRFVLKALPIKPTSNATPS